MVVLLTAAAAADDPKRVPESAQVHHHFEIPAQPLAGALMRFGQQSGLMILVPSSLTRGKLSRAISGELIVQDALERLLEGSQLEFSWTADDVLSFRPASGPPSAGERPATRGASTSSTASAIPATESSLLSELVVTGSLIQDLTFSKATPVVSIDAQEIELRGSNLPEELLRTLPGSVAGLGAEVTNNTYGASTVNLRGLGENRNLVLLDGARLTPWGLDGSADLNDIPLALIERVEILTGGASTTYGADAVAGVVNFITRRDFSGVDIESSDQINQRGDGNTVRSDLILAGNFAGNRGNGVLSLGYQDSHGLYRTDRLFSSKTYDSYTGQEGTSPDTVPAEFSLPGKGVLQLDPVIGSLGPEYRREDTGAYGTLEAPFKRFNVYFSGTYGVNDRVEAYEQGFYTKYLLSAPFAPTQTDGALVSIPYSNPYLPAGVRSQFCTANGLSASRCAAAAAAPSPQDPDYATFQTEVFRSILEAGRTGLDFNNDLYQVRLGLRGELTDQLHFDIYGTEGRGENLQTLTSNALYSSLQQGVLATNTTRCLNTANHCVPIDLFGNTGGITPAQASFLTGGPSYIDTRTSLATVHAALDGALDVKSPLADTPAGVALGGEYRRYTVGTLPDEISQTPGELLDDIPTPQFSGAYNVKEGFAELIAPLIEHRPLLQRLTLELGGRVSDYSTAGTSFTWKAGGTWAPVGRFSFRGMLQVAARAPNIGELYTPLAATFNSIASDPCAGPKVTPSSSLGRICIAQGAPASALGTVTTPSEANGVTGGDLNLGVEKARSYTLGAKFQADETGDTGISTDYYHIVITHAITTPTVADVLNECFGSAYNPTLAVTAACTVIRRNPITGDLYGDQITTPGVPLLLSNLGLLGTDGVDGEITQRVSLPFGKLTLGVQGNWTHSSSFKATPTSINRQCAGYYSVNCTSIQPKLSWNQRSTLEWRAFDFSVLWRFIGSERYEPQALIDAGGPAYGPLSQFRYIPNYSYFDFTTQWRPASSAQFSLVVQNLFDKQPPLVGSTIGYLTYNTANTYPATYDVQGRRFGLTVHYRF